MEITAITNYIDDLMSDPARWQTGKQKCVSDLTDLVEAYVDEKPHTMEDLLVHLRDEFPFLQDNLELLERGAEIREEVLQILKNPLVFDEDADNPADEPDPFSAEIAKAADAKMQVFEKLVSMNKTLSTLLENISGDQIRAISKKVKSRRDRKIIEPTTGAAQRWLKERGE